MSDSEIIDNTGKYFAESDSPAQLQLTMSTLRYVLIFVAIAYLLTSIVYKFVFGNEHKQVTR